MNKKKGKEKLIMFEKKIRENIITILKLIIAVAGVIVALIGVLDNKISLRPQFSLEVIQHEDNVDDLNRTLKIYNSGGKIVNPNIKPIMQIELSCITCKNRIPNRESNILIEFSDYFSEDYSYNNAESAFIIKEKNANAVYDLLNKINSKLEEEKEYISFFSVKYYFRITYYNHKGKKKERILYPMNNDAQILYRLEPQKRYFQDNELKKIEKIKSADIIMPIDFDEESGVIHINIDKRTYQQTLVEKGEKSYDCISAIIKHFMQNNSHKLKQSNQKQLNPITNKIPAKEIVKNNMTFIGFIEKNEEKNYKKVVIFMTVIFISIIISMLGLKKLIRKRQSRFRRKRVRQKRSKQRR